MSPQNPQRPTIAPEVMVEQVSANANWKTQYASSGMPVVRYVSGNPLRKNPLVPIHGVPGSNMKANPQAQNVTPQIQVSTMPSTRMLIDSRDRANPASSMTKPTCMQKTRNAAMSVHAVLMALISGVGPAAGAWANTAGLTNARITVSKRIRPMALPPASASTLARIAGSLILVFTRLSSIETVIVLPP